METEDYDDPDSEACYEPYPQTRGGKGRRNTRSSKKSGRLTPKDEGVSSGLDVRRQRAHIASLVNRPSVDNVAQIDTGRANRRFASNKARAVVEEESLLAQIWWVFLVSFSLCAYLASPLLPLQVTNSNHQSLPSTSMACPG